MPNAPVHSAPLPVPSCPKCAGPMFDNRRDKIGHKAPDFRCQDELCVGADGRRTAVWERDVRRAAATAPKPAAPAARAAAAVFRASTDDCKAIAKMHRACLASVHEHEYPTIKHLGGDVAGAIAQLVGQLFEECRRGA